MVAKRVLLISLVSVLGAVGCQTVQTTSPGVVGVTRPQRVLVSEQEVRQAANQAYAQEVSKARSAGKLDTDAALTRRVQEISRKLIAQTSVFRPDAPSWNWEVHTLTTKDMNAFAMPGGKIMVFTGLAEGLKLSDDELAAVIGHEIAHALREHTRERISRAMTQQIALTGVAVVTGVSGSVLDMANMVGAVTFQLPHSREQESEADAIGLELMARAGYDPRAAVTVWQKMSKANQSGGPPEFLSTHPSPSTRIQELQALIPKVEPLRGKGR